MCIDTFDNTIKYKCYIQLFEHDHIPLPLSVIVNTSPFTLAQ